MCAGLEGREGFPPEASKLPLDSRIKSRLSVRPTLRLRSVAGSGLDGSKWGSSVVFNIYGSVPGDDVGGDPHAADGGRRSDTDVDLLKWRRRAEGEPPGGTRRFRSLLFVLIALLLLTMTPSCCR